MKIVWVLLSLLAAASALTQEQAGNDDWCVAARRASAHPALRRFL